MKCGLTAFSPQLMIEKTIEPIRKDIVSLARKVLRIVRAENSPAKIRLSEWISGNIKENFDSFNNFFLLHNLLF